MKPTKLESLLEFLETAEAMGDKIGVARIKQLIIELKQEEV